MCDLQPWQNELLAFEKTACEYACNGKYSLFFYGNELEALKMIMKFTTMKNAKSVSLPFNVV
jgi:hypothetical protein